jgi:hypothetical protein
MRVRTLGFFCLLVLQALTAVAQGDYSRYETIDVSPYRVRSAFTLPVPPPPPPAAPPAAKASDLDRYFRNGNKLYIDADPRLEALVKRHIEQNQRVTSIQGFRIQVYSGPNREDAYRYKGALLDLPAYASYLDFEDPNYRVRLGDFSNREEAEVALRKVKIQFPESFIVPAQVKPVRARNVESGG